MGLKVFIKLILEPKIGNKKLQVYEKEDQLLYIVSLV